MCVMERGALMPTWLWVYGTWKAYLSQRLPVQASAADVDMLLVHDPEGGLEPALVVGGHVHVGHLCAWGVQGDPGQPQGQALNLQPDMATLLRICNDRSWHAGRPNICISLVHRRPWRTYLFSEENKRKIRRRITGTLVQRRLESRGKNTASPVRRDSNPSSTAGLPAGEIRAPNSSSFAVIFIQICNQRIILFSITTLLSKKLAISCFSMGYFHPWPCSGFSFLTFPFHAFELGLLLPCLYLMFLT